MLVSLSVQHFVIVERLELDVANGFTVMTGETGAGKSILIDALDLLLGGRADASAVREGATKADLAARFEVGDVTEVIEWLRAAELSDPNAESTVLIRRTIDAQGKSKSWINGQAATLTQLKELGELLVDIHGQHKARLLHPKSYDYFVMLRRKLHWSTNPLFVGRPDPQPPSESH